MAKILIAEDEQDIRDLIEFTLKYYGHEVISVSDGEEAVSATHQIHPDLILLDVRMPVLDGYEACKIIKADKMTKEIPVVFLSAKGQAAEISQGLQAGAVDYLLKPFAPDELNKRLLEILERHI